MYEQLFIAEKPSVGRSIAQALFKNNKPKDGYIECEGGKYAVTWAFGHLVGLAYPEEYDEKYKGTWKIEDCPIIPKEFKRTVNEGAKKQLGIIRKLGKNSKVCVNACDSAREGELIFHYAALETGLYSKPVKRLWTSSVTEEGIRKAYKSLKDASETKNLLASAIARSEADWLIGINATRAFTSQVGAGETVNIGRVKAPLVAMVYDRCKAIEDFQKKTYYVVESDFEQGDTTYKGVLDREPFDSMKEAEDIAEQVKYESGKIESYETDVKKVYAPKLYNLTSLTSDANAKYGFSAKEVLSIAQELYEREKCITYPRTSSNYVTKDEIPFMRGVFKVLEGTEYRPAIEKANIKFLDEKNKKICNEKHVEDHHAILPTEKVPNELNKKEQQVYDLIVKRFIAQCYPPAEYLRHVIKTDVKGYLFHSSFKELQVVGWKYVDNRKDENEIDEIRTGPFSIIKEQTVRCLDSSGVEKETEPPKPYTEGKLISAMETAGKELDDDELKEALKDSGIGTPATRAGAIEGVKSVKYVALKGKSLIVTEKGKALIEMLRSTKINSLTSPEYTGKWEKKLNEIARGEYDSKKFIELAVKFTYLIVEEAKKQDVKVKSEVEEIGTCPLCREGMIVATKSAFGCNKWQQNGCEYRIWKKQFGRTINAKQAKSLLDNGITEELTFAPKDKNKRKYKAKLRIKDDTGNVEILFCNKDFGKCPKCKVGIIMDRGGFLGCSSFPDCRFTFSKKIKDKVLTEKQLEKLFLKGETELISGFKDDEGKSFSARLINEDGNFKMRGK